MKDMERRKFEDSFKEAFKDAEANPSEIVWANIELELEKSEGGKMKRRLMFFKTLAAASVFFAVMVGGIGYYFLKDSAQHETLADRTKAVEQNNTTRNENSKDNQEATSDNNSEGSTSEPNTNKSTEDNEAATQNSLSDKTQVEKKGEVEQSNATVPQHADVQKSQPSDDVKQSNGPTAPTKANGEMIQNKTASSAPSKTLPKARDNNEASDIGVKNDQISNNQLASNEILGDDEKETLTKEGARTPLLANEGSSGKSLPPFFKLQDPTLKIENSQPDPGAVLLAKLAAEEQVYAQNDEAEKKKNSEKLWTSLGFAAGGFNALSPSVSPNNTLASANLNNAAVKQSKASGVAYSVGFSVGTKISKRWIVQGGFNYMTQSSDYTANSVVVDNNFQSPQAESLNAYKGNMQLSAADANQKVAPTVPYTVNNNVQFVSLPVQAGYMFINKRFGLQLNAGVSTDLFLQNTITPEAGGLSKTTQSRGADSPYRSLNFSGLMGTEFSYKLGTRYRVALNPGLRYPFNSVYKTDTGVNSTPLTFDVGLRFRYIFH